MSKVYLLAIALLLCVAGAWADIYLHGGFRGSNNRLNEKNANTRNENRLFDSQNNARGGYCWGPPITLYEGSLSQIEWTSQHGCGAQHSNVDCDIILQYMCGPWVRDGTTFEAFNYGADDHDEKDAAGNYIYGQHEPESFFRHCNSRKRNMGLFTADRVLRNNLPRNGGSARRTRQNNNGQRYGFECPEERDYYPYWHPTPWKDIAVLTSNTMRCSFFRDESQNVKEKGWCEDPVYGQQAECPADKWQVTAPWGLDPPDCVENEWNRDNHLGNARSGRANKYDWVLPQLSHPSFTGSYAPYADVPAVNDVNDRSKGANCVFRIRYNISTAEVKGWEHLDYPLSGTRMLDYTSNDEVSPVRQNPYISYGPVEDSLMHNLSLAIATNQVGRTFQERSHMFILKPRPPNVPSGARIFNLMVRGRRGNIVQAYPAVEYDFSPNDLKVYDGDYVHFQWTGCDTHPDNQAGEGTDGTDRSNIVQIDDGRSNYPTDFNSVTMFKDPDDIFAMAHLDQPQNYCETGTESNCCKTLAQLHDTNNNNADRIEEDKQNCAKLNYASPHFERLIRMTGVDQTYHYMSTRNNNFSNRSQKGKITVMGLIPWWGVAAVAVGGAGFVGAAILAAGVWVSGKNAGSGASNIFGNCRV